MPYTKDYIIDVEAHSASGSAEQITTQAGATYVEIINEHDGAGANGTLLVGNSSANCLIPVGAGDRYVMQLGPGQEVWVNGNSSADDIVLVWWGLVA